MSVAACSSLATPVHRQCATLLVNASTGRLRPSGATAYQPRSGSQNDSRNSARKASARRVTARPGWVSPNPSARSARASSAA